jgi:hypothetical protein
LKPQNLLFEKDEYLTPELEPSALKDQIEDLIGSSTFVMGKRIERGRKMG